MVVTVAVVMVAVVAINRAGDTAVPSRQLAYRLISDNLLTTLTTQERKIKFCEELAGFA